LANRERLRRHGRSLNLPPQWKVKRQDFLRELTEERIAPVDKDQACHLHGLAERAPADEPCR
jgi:hypothetical protein